jgi:DNA-binding CsgD family transcriptional regulator
LCDKRGIVRFHSADSRRDTVGGWPDLTLIGRSGILYRELKSGTGRPSREQLRTLDLLRRAGGNADIWRPGDLASGRIAGELHAIGSLRAGAEVFSDLTRREFDVLSGLMRGMDNHQIADAMGLTLNTVHSHVRRIFAKTGIHNRTRIAISAVHAGIVHKDISYSGGAD